MPDKFTVSDAVVARLLEWGVKRIYGFPGDGVNGVMGALRRSKDRIEFIQVAHEELAGMAATAHTKFTGESNRGRASDLLLTTEHVLDHYLLACHEAGIANIIGIKR